MKALLAFVLTYVAISIALNVVNRLRKRAFYRSHNPERVFALLETLTTQLAHNGEAPETIDKIKTHLNECRRIMTEHANPCPWQGCGIAYFIGGALFYLNHDGIRIPGARVIQELLLFGHVHVRNDHNQVVARLKPDELAGLKTTTNFEDVMRLRSMISCKRFADMVTSCGYDRAHYTPN